MKSFAAILFATLAVLAFTSAVPLPEDQDSEPTTSTKDTRNQDCKKPFQAAFDSCKDGAVECQIPYTAGNLQCDKDFPSSSAY
ncbi:MAG: hypothetical protein JOS17DRAFT_541166 [Linnemannia elongata]|nr:MAG: hypothetical protein JOS17DRAFT_541166 [Linnemannia elongata]